jgi:hypothetical protein
MGYDVFRSAEHSNVFHIRLDDVHSIRISAGQGKAQVQLSYLDNVVNFLDVSSPPGLEHAVAEHARRVPGVNWPAGPSSGRLSDSTPASNYHTLSRLIGMASVEAVFDPYLTNGALEELRTILSFGDGSIANGIRLLGSASTSSGSTPRLSKGGVDAWLSQLGITGEARVVPAQSEHRRFLLLSGGTSLLLGHSLNAIHKNEAVRVESDSSDRAFFEATWSTASLLT